MGNINNIFKIFSSFEKRIEASYTKNNSSYNTNFDLVDKNGKIIHCDRRKSCFTRLTESCNHNSGKWIKFGTGQKLYVYALEQDTILTESEITTYMKCVKKFNLPFKLHIKEDYDLNYMSLVRQYEDHTKYITENNASHFRAPSQISYDNNSGKVLEIIKSQNKRELKDFDRSKDPLVCFKRQKVYILEIDLNVHKTMTTVKLLLYLFRFIYEFDFDIVLKELLERKSRYPKESFFNSLNVLQFKFYHSVRDEKYNKLMRTSGFSSRYRIGHCLYNTKLYANVTDKQIKEKIKKQINHELEYGYRDDIMYKIFWSLPYINVLMKVRYGDYNCDPNKKVITNNDSINSYFKSLLSEKDINNLVKSSNTNINSFKVFIHQSDY